MRDESKKFEELMNRMFEEFGNMLPYRKRHLSLPFSGSELISGSKKPFIDIIESDNEIIATAEMPGLNKEDIDINLTNERLEISAKTKHEEEKEDKDYIYRERRSGNYYRSISLPSSIDTTGVKASYNNGILEIKMPKTHTKKRTPIKVE